ncbi:MAG: hypothetical protein SVX43_16375 [Cyanobacteriota bacterium]|nr:hypothetical protein [Cyanobacteriota bacterium]
MISAFVIADECLNSYNGHYFNYDRTIQDYARSQGYDVTIIANAAASSQIAEALKVIPGFRYGLEHHFKFPIPLREKIQSEWNYFQYKTHFHRDLCQIEARLNLNRETLILFHTISHNQLYPIVKWAEHLPPDKCPKIALLFRFTPYINPTQLSPNGRFYRRAFRYLERSHVCKRFRLFTDSDILVNDYRDFTEIPLTVLPIPHAASEKDESIEREKRDAETAICLTYLGNARSTKGFHLLPYLFKRLGCQLERSQLKAEVQANVMFQHDTPSVLAVTQLRQNRPVKLHETALSEREYEALLDRAGIVLLPYSLCYYHAQTSGIFGEAIARGKPVIVPRGTWMAKQLKTQGAGLTFLPGDAQSFYETVCDAIAQYPELKSKAEHQAEAWANHHCPATFFKTLIERFSQD